MDIRKDNIANINTKLIPEGELPTTNIFSNNPGPLEGNEMLGVKYAIYSTVIYGFLAFHIKLAKTYYVDTFDTNVFLFWRSLPLILIAYGSVKQKSEKILNLSEIKIQKLFISRCILNYFNLMFFTLSMLDLRAATASCISSMSPAVMIFFSIILLKEKFHLRYLTGILICFTGSAMIILNENKQIPISVGEDTVVLEDIYVYMEEVSASVAVQEIPDVIRGVFYGFYHIIVNSLISVLQKLLAKEKIPIETQMFYIGISNSVMAVVFVAITGLNTIDLSLGLFCSFNGVLFYISIHYFNESMKHMPLAKFSPFLYLTTLTVFVCGVLLVGEPLFFTDVLGSLLILSFNVYDSCNPLKKD